MSIQLQMGLVVLPVPGKTLTYFLGLQGSSASEFYPPQLNHEVLVEGTVTTEARICGGIPSGRHSRDP